MLAKLACDGYCKREFQKIRKNKGNDTPLKRQSETDGAGPACVNGHKPCCSERVTNKKPEKQNSDSSRKLSSEKGFAKPIQQADEDESDHITAGGAEKSAHPAGKTGKHGNADSRQKNIDENGDRSELSTEKFQYREDGKGLEGERNDGGNADPRTNGN